MSIISFSKSNLFSKSLIKNQNQTAMLKYPHDADESHFMRFHFIEFPDIATRQTRGPEKVFDKNSGLSGPKVYNESSIFLCMPEQLAIANGQEWEVVDLGIFGKTVEAITSAALDTGDSIQNIKNAGTAVGSIIGNAIFDATGFNNAKSATFNVISNPFKDVLYRGPKLRSFNFKWVMVPKNEDDCNTIKNIIDSFRYHSAPEKKSDMGLSLFGFPGAFEISFHSYNAAFNSYLPQLGYCIISNVDTNYTPNAMFSAFRNGHPIEVELTLDVQEIQPITRAELKKENPNSMAAQMKTNTSSKSDSPQSGISKEAIEALMDGQWGTDKV